MVQPLLGAALCVCCAALPLASASDNAFTTVSDIIVSPVHIVRSTAVDCPCSMSLFPSSFFFSPHFQLTQLHSSTIHIKLAPGCQTMGLPAAMGGNQPGQHRMVASRVLDGWDS